jgi:hypothetical protein|tara:strand:+ start:269 stop:790 length:522 start_codon:yes stop_codon:yes gene_type:complete
MKEGTMQTLKFKYTTSKGRDTYGYNICSLWINGEKVSSTCGGGYDMKGTALGIWIARKFQDQLLKFKDQFYGLKFYNPNWKPSTECLEQEKKDELTKLTGLARYQDFYKQSSDLPTEKHTQATLDGACGFECMIKILNNIGYNLKYVDGTSNTSTYILGDNVTNLYIPKELSA